MKRPGFMEKYSRASAERTPKEVQVATLRADVTNAPLFAAINALQAVGKPVVLTYCRELYIPGYSTFPAHIVLSTVTDAE
jgi:hypothetical protein